MDPNDVVREFLGAMEKQDFAAAMELVDDDIVWRNTSLPTIRGARRLRWILDGMAKYRIGFSAIFRHVAAQGDTVLTERTDVLTVGRVRIEFWVCGTFELHEGRIMLWHDHFSVGNVLRGTVVGALKAAISAIRT